MNELLQKRKLTWGERIIIFIVCVAINLVGKAIAAKCGLPIWLDMQGTCVASFTFMKDSGIVSVTAIYAGCVKGNSACSSIGIKTGKNDGCRQKMLSGAIGI